MKKVVTFALALAIIVTIWQTVIYVLHIQNFILPSPMEVVLVIFQQKQLIWVNTLDTLQTALIGFILGSCFGIISALIIAYFKRIKFWLLPMLIMSQALPTFAIAPLLVVWLGYGVAAKLVTVMIMIFFPVTSGFLDGLQKTNQEWLELARSMRASKLQTFIWIRIPAALPHLATGLRTAATIAPIGAVIGEWVGANNGLGYLILNANARLEIDLMFAALISLIGISLLLYYSIDVLLKKWLRWHY